MFFFKNTGTLRVFFWGHDKFTCFKTTKRIFLVLLFNNTQTLRVFCKPHANFSCGCLIYKGGGSFTRGVIFISILVDFFISWKFLYEFRKYTYFLDLGFKSNTIAKTNTIASSGTDGTSSGTKKIR